MNGLPTYPLPADAGATWLGIWLSVCRLSDGAGAAVQHAFDAGVDPAEFCGVLLDGPTGQEPPAYPVLTVGMRQFSPLGEVRQ